jgi:alkyldihydroxyacetonephosphate synthase
VIPFGGGTNISGSLEAPRRRARPVISLDLGRLDRVLEIDEDSRIARVQAGILGPALEEELNRRGWTLGHFPGLVHLLHAGRLDRHRSSGCNRQVRRRGRPHAAVPRRHAGRHPRHAPGSGVGDRPERPREVLGSEGRLGFITEATVHVHRVPERRVILG